MNILAFESSCDETAVAVVQDGRTVLSDAILSQADMHALYGGVVPEIASRKHVEAIAGLTDQALRDAGLTKQDIDAVAVTYAPGLIGAVLVGVNFAKSAAAALRFGNGNNRADSIDFFWHKSSPAKMLCGQATANTANAQGVSIRLIIMLCAFRMALYIS